MATTARGVPYPVGADNNDGPAAFLGIANFVNDNPGVHIFTTTQRDALAGGDLWTGRVIYNSTTNIVEYYDGTIWQGGWIDVAAAAITFAQSATVTKTANYAAYKKIGRSVRWQGQLVVTGAGTAANSVGVSVPFTIRTGAFGTHPRPIGTGILFDTSASLYYRAIAVPVSATAIQFIATNSTSAAFLGVSDFTAALAAGDEVSWDVEYEAAA